jgi:hypothetical protein
MATWPFGRAYLQDFFIIGAGMTSFGRMLDADPRP